MSGGGDDEGQTHTAAVVWIDGECGEEFRAMGRDSLSGRECERADERASERRKSVRAPNGGMGAVSPLPRNRCTRQQRRTHSLSGHHPSLLGRASGRLSQSGAADDVCPFQLAASSAAAKASSRKAAISTEISDFKSLLALHTHSSSAAQPTKFERRLRLGLPPTLSLRAAHTVAVPSPPRMQMTSHSCLLSQLELARAARARARAPGLAVPRPGPHTCKP